MSGGLHTLAGIFVMVTFVSLFSAAWVWIWDVRVAYALVYTGVLAFVFGMISSAAGDYKK